jgi:hypothetical protein
MGDNAGGLIGQDFGRVDHLDFQGHLAVRMITKPDLHRMPALVSHALISSDVVRVIAALRAKTIGEDLQAGRK